MCYSADIKRTESSTVCIARATSYDPVVVREALAAVLAPLGGMRAFVCRGDRVLLKPNFLSGKTVEHAVSTHPEVILAVAEAALDAGAEKVSIGDSPGIGSALGVARKIKLLGRAQEMGVDLLNFSDAVVVQHKEGARFKRFEVERTTLEVDKIINLPKLKTHAQMFLTLAVKNTFGCVVGKRKTAWHLEAGRDADLFAMMLLDLHTLVAPVVNIIDGIVMMEGNGPGAGNPRDLGLLAASPDAVALDRILCDRILGLPLGQLYTHKAAEKEGIGNHDAARILLTGTPIEQVAINDVRHPRLIPVEGFFVPRRVRNFARRLIEVRPVVDQNTCDGCAICQDICPAKAIDIIGAKKDSQRAEIIPELCVHCYCCQEVCPQGAIHPRRGLARKLMRRPAS